MPADLNVLIPTFRTCVEHGLARLAKEGLIFRPYFTIRDPVTQAGLWRQSRSSAVVAKKIAELKASGCSFIAACLEKAGPRVGPWATNALPGLSWHQYGEAVDCYLEDAKGQPAWEASNYSRFGQIGDQCGMMWGGHFGDPDHWRYRHVEPDTAFGAMREINDKLQIKWPHLVPVAMVR